VRRFQSACAHPQVWVSRTEPFAHQSAERLAALGYACLVPLMHVAYARSTPDLTGVGTLVFTSRNGVAAFARRRPERRFSVFAVGDATAAAARRAGFARVASAAGDVVALRRLVRAQARRDLGAVLRVGAAEPAGTLVADLVADGFEVADWPAYRTDFAPERQIFDAIGALKGDLAAVLLYSPKAARALGRLLAKRSLSLGRLVCISPATAEAVAAHADYPVRIAKRPNEASLFAALRAGEPGRRDARGLISGTTSTPTPTPSPTG
jgi:uroporphyrinogen-III synthase